MKLEGRVAAITGGTRGIGRAIAEAVLREGGLVLMNGRSREKYEATVEEIGAPDRCHFFPGDVTDKAVAEGLVDETIKRFGKIDILVNNAGGIRVPAPFVDLPDDEWDYAIAWNLNAPFWSSRRAIPDMLKRNWGRIINMSSMYGKMSTPSVAHYVTTKHGLNGLTKAIAAEFGQMGITCNSICPGLIITDIVRDTAPDTAATIGMTYDEYVDFVVSPSMIKRPNTVEEVAAMAVLLCSEEGGGITGTMMSVDGGSAPY
jgi:NAD(P)-dependent dehydrogenase (short-subunit alcohol dehydrogenase family)